MKSRRGMVIGVELPEDLSKLAQAVADRIAKERGGARRAALAYEFADQVHIMVIEKVMLLG